MTGEAVFWHVVLQEKGPLPAASLSAGYATAVNEGLAGLYYRRVLERGGLPEGPEPATAYRQTAGHNLVAQIWLGRLLGAGAEFVLLPGAGLMPLYPDLGCRWMEDMDLLVPSGARRRMEEALRRIGAAPLSRHPDLWTVERPPGRAVFDLHADLVNGERVRTRRWAGWLDPAKAWEGRQPRRWDGLNLQVLCPEDALLYSAAHAVRHGFRRLAWIVDVGLLLTHVDWRRLQERARESRLERPLRYCLDSWQKNGGGLEPPVAEWLRTAVWGRFEKRVYARAIAERGAPPWGDALLAGNIPGCLRRWLFWVETCFPRPTVLRQVYPALPRGLAALGYLWRAGQLGGDAVKLIGRLGKRLFAAKRGEYVK